MPTFIAINRIKEEDSVIIHASSLQIAEIRFLDYLKNKNDKLIQGYANQLSSGKFITFTYPDCKNCDKAERDCDKVEYDEDGECIEMCDMEYTLRKFFETEDRYNNYLKCSAGDKSFLSDLLIFTMVRNKSRILNRFAIVKLNSLPEI